MHNRRRHDIDDGISGNGFGTRGPSSASAVPARADPRRRRRKRRRRRRRKRRSRFTGSRGGDNGVEAEKGRN